MGDASQHTSQDLERTWVMQVSILHQVNILFKIKKPQLCMSVIQFNILLGEAIQ